MAELTDFAALPPRQVLMRHELAASVNAVAVGSAPSPAALALVGRGIAHAAGSEAVFTIGDRKGRWTPDELRRLMSEPMYRDLYEAAERQAQVDVLSGPSPEEAASLRERGWAPEQSRAVAWKRAEQEAEQARRLTQDTTEPWRKGRLRDVVAAEELVVEVLSPLNVMFADGAATLETLTGGTAEGVRRLTRSMPTFEAAVGFKTQYHRNAAHTWTANDVLDIDALAIALP
jgi:hypothetical protein